MVVYFIRWRDFSPGLYIATIAGGPACGPAGFSLRHLPYAGKFYILATASYASSMKLADLSWAPDAIAAPIHQSLCTTRVSMSI